MKTFPTPLLRLLPILGIIGLLALEACSGKKEPPKPAGGNAPVIVDVIVAREDRITNQLEVNGEVAANEFVELHPEVSGRLVYLNVPEGSPIGQGTIVARINDADLQAQLSKTKLQHKLAQQTESRLKQLLDVSGINQADYDAALNQVNSLQAEIDYTNALIEKTIVRAPFSGIIGLRQVSPGAYVTPATVIATLQQVQQLKIDFSVPEEYSAFVQKNNTVLVRTSLSEDSLQKAIVSAVEPQASRETRNLKVRAILSGDKANPGAFVKVFLGTGSGSNSILIPTNAVIPDAMSKKVVTVKGGKAVFVEVKTGVRQDRLIEVTEGLQPGDTVVVDGVLFARPNAAVKVRAVKRLEEMVD
jgi:membrane fusion protein, multidrug efflux system